MSDDRPRVDITAAPDEVTRRELLRRAAAGAVVLVYGGFGAKSAVAGAPKFRGKELKGTLRILQWSHFVPAYDQWFDNQYTKRWGQANDTDVIVDHVNQADLPGRVAAEAAAGKGHDMVALLAPAPQYEDRVIDHKEIVQEVRHKRGKMADVCFRSAYNPKTKKFHGFPDSYAPDPINYRTDLWGQVGSKPTSWDRVLKAAPKLRAMNHPIGIGMSNELDSNMALIALLQCFGAFIQTRHAQVAINSKHTVEALKFMRNLYKHGMTNEIFAWTASSNNQGYLACRLSLAVNARSIIRSAEDQNPSLAKNTGLAAIPRGPVQRLGLEHIMGVYTIWKFSKNKSLAKRFIADLEINYAQAFTHSKYYNFPAFRGAVHNYNKILASDPHTPKGKYVLLGRIASKYTTNVGHPGFANAAVDEVWNKYLIPQMFAEVAQDKSSAADAARSMQGQFKDIFAKWRRRGKI